MYSLWYDDHFWEAKGQWECPCDEGPFQVRDTSLSCSPKDSSLSRRDSKGLKSLKDAEQFLTVTPSLGGGCCCRDISGSRGKSWCYCFPSVSHSSAPASATPGPGFPLNAQSSFSSPLSSMRSSLFPQSAKNWQTELVWVFIWYQHCRDRGGKAVSVLRHLVLFSVRLLWQRLVLAVLGQG